jgi:hypothetical protein
MAHKAVLMCELCERNEGCETDGIPIKLYGVLYSNAASLSVYCTTCIKLPINKDALKGCRFFELKETSIIT